MNQRIFLQKSTRFHKKTLD